MAHYRGLSSYGPLQGVVQLWSTTGGCPVMAHYRGLPSYGPLQGVVQLWPTTGGCPVMVYYRGLSSYGPLQGVVQLWPTTGGCPVMVHYRGCPVMVHYRGYPVMVHYRGCPVMAHYRGCPVMASPILSFSTPVTSYFQQIKINKQFSLVFSTAYPQLFSWVLAVRGCHPALLMKEDIPQKALQHTDPPKYTWNKGKLQNRYRAGWQRARQHRARRA